MQNPHKFDPAFVVVLDDGIDPQLGVFSHLELDDAVVRYHGQRGLEPNRIAAFVKCAHWSCVQRCILYNTTQVMKQKHKIFEIRKVHT